MEVIISIITCLTVMLGLMKAFLELCIVKQRARNSRKRSATNRTPSKD